VRFVDPGLVDVVSRCLVREPEQRIQSAEELVALLSSCTGGGEHLRGLAGPSWGLPPPHLAPQASNTDGLTTTPLPPRDATVPLKKVKFVPWQPVSRTAPLVPTPAASAYTGPRSARTVSLPSGPLHRAPTKGAEPPLQPAAAGAQAQSIEIQHPGSRSRIALTMTMALIALIGLAGAALSALR